MPKSLPGLCSKLLFYIHNKFGKKKNLSELVLFWYEPGACWNFSYFMCIQAGGIGYFRGAANGLDILRRAGAWQNPREATPNKTLAASLPLVS